MKELPAAKAAAAAAAAAAAEISAPSRAF